MLHGARGVCIEAWCPFGWSEDLVDLASKVREHQMHVGGDCIAIATWGALPPRGLLHKRTGLPVGPLFQCPGSTQWHRVEL